MVKCPYCGRILRPGERYCWFCEQCIDKTINEDEKPKFGKEAKESDIKKLVKLISSWKKKRKKR